MAPVVASLSTLRLAVPHNPVHSNIRERFEPGEFNSPMKRKLINADVAFKHLLGGSCCDSVFDRWNDPTQTCERGVTPPELTLRDLSGVIK